MLECSRKTFIVTGQQFTFRIFGCLFFFFFTLTYFDLTILVLKTSHKPEGQTQGIVPVSDFSWNLLFLYQNGLLIL